MSHGGGGEGRPVDPNLTPLLDLVLQLLMFFIMCVNFVTDQVSPDILLPYSESGEPIQKADVDKLFINLKALKTEDGKKFLERMPPEQFERFEKAEAAVLIPGLRPKTMSEARAWLKQQYEDAKTAAQARGEKEVKTVVIFRPDGDLDLKQFFLMMDFCKNAGYKNLMLHTKKRGGTG
jgi:biopolymer transport protein ExbD